MEAEGVRQKSRDYYAKNKERIRQRTLERWKLNKNKPLPDEQVCTKCGELKPVSEFVFLKLKHKYTLQCRKCIYQQSKVRTQRLMEQGLCVSCSSPKEDLKKKYCVVCNKKYAERSKRDRLEAKQACVTRLGGKCSRCGLETTILDIYDFHHESEDKEANLGLLLAKHRSLSKKILQELDKCVLYCANCHRIKHWELNNTGENI